MGSFVGDTQPPPLSGDNYKDKDYDHIFGCTFPFMETAPCDDGLETQVMNIEDETPVLFEDGFETPIMNFEGDTQVLFEDELETQVIDFVDETQVLDDFDGFENLDAQLLDEWNNEETDKIDGEESDKSNELCDIEDSDKLVCSSQDHESTAISKKDDKPNEAELDASFYNQTSAGVKLDFTSIRVAAIRASGLAAREKASSNEITDICLSVSEDESPKGNPTLKISTAISIRTPVIHSLENNESPLEEEQVRIKETEIGNSTERQFSMYDVEVVENEGQYEVKDVGLSNVDSQEPGEWSQTNALEFVDKFIKSSETIFTKAFDTVGSTAEKLKSVSSIKRIHNLARRNGLKCQYNGIYDWDDNLEDEGGGEFFNRKKNIFFDEEEKISPSKMLKLKRTRKKAKIVEVKKNLPKELDENLNVNLQDGAKAMSSEKHLQDICNVRTDSEQTHEGSTGERGNEKLPHKYSLRKRCGPSSYDDLTRKLKVQKISCTNLNRGKTVAFLKEFKNMRKQHKKFVTFDAVSPSSWRGQVRSCAPIASRTRQSIGKNITFDSSIDMSCRKGRKNRGRLSDNGKQPVKQFVGQHKNEKSCEISNQSKRKPSSFFLNQGIKRLTRSSLCVNTASASSDKESERDFCKESGYEEELKKGNSILKFIERDCLKLDVSPGDRSELSVLTSSSPASPICMGDEYITQSCRKNLSKLLIKKISRKVSYGVEPFMLEKPMKRKDMSNVRVIFSHHLDDNIIKYQKKIVAKLGSSLAYCIREATHFVADQFVRTRNMLEAIALGKPVVTHHWLESCEQASCFIDERSYILRDAKKEREFGFSLPTSLAHASQHPLLQGLKVWITPNTRPGLDILSSLVKAVHGLPVKRIGRSVLKDEKVPDDLIVLSCKEDYAACLPFIEKGGVVFSSELLLDGIVSQNLDYERHRLFDDHVKKTRSTIWVKQNTNQYLRVTKGN